MWGQRDPWGTDMPGKALKPRRTSGLPTDYNPERGLKTIAVAEAAEKHWRRAKDTGQLFKAIEAKINAQAEYVVWRDSVVRPSQELSGAGRGKGFKGINDRKSPKLPEGDPGAVIIHRWRKKLTTNAKGVTKAGVIQDGGKSCTCARFERLIEGAPGWWQSDTCVAFKMTGCQAMFQV